MWDVGGVGGCLGDGAPAHAGVARRRGPVVLEGHAVALVRPEVFFGAVTRFEKNYRGSAPRFPHAV